MGNVGRCCSWRRRLLLSGRRRAGLAAGQERRDGQQRKGERGTTAHMQHSFQMVSGEIHQTGGRIVSPRPGGRMKVAELMQTTLKTISTEAAIADAVVVFAEAQVS